MASILKNFRRIRIWFELDLKIEFTGMKQQQVTAILEFASHFVGLSPGTLTSVKGENKRSGFFLLTIGENQKVFNAARLLGDLRSRDDSINAVFREYDVRESYERLGRDGGPSRFI